MNKTNIDWVKNPDGSQGYTWNPITGCLNGCEYCYARKLANGRLRSRYLANKNWDTHTPKGYEGYPNLDPFYPRFWEDRLDELNSVYGQDTRALHRGIFVCDMSDFFGIGVPEEWTRQVIERIKEFPLHRFYLLTKQPQKLQKFSPFPDNCWVGVTITEPYPDNTPLAYFAKVEAKVKYISFEPLLKWGTDLTSVLKMSFEEAGINWVIIGAQTKPYKPPQVEWVREIVEACDKAGIPVFLKYNLRRAILFTEDNSSLFQSIPGIPTGFKLRQETPGLLCKTG